MASLKVTFELSQEQKDAIIHFINFNNWNVNVTEEQNALTGNWTFPKTRVTVDRFVQFCK